MPILRRTSVYLQHLVLMSVSFGDCTVGRLVREQSLTNLPTVRSPKETDIEPDVVNIRGLLEKYPTFGREKETGLLGALDT